ALFCRHRRHGNICTDLSADLAERDELEVESIAAREIRRVNAEAENLVGKRVDGCALRPGLGSQPGVQLIIDSQEELPHPPMISTVQSDSTVGFQPIDEVAHIALEVRTGLDSV